MTKLELVTFIMANTEEYKKTHMMEMYKADLEVIAATFGSDEAEDTANASESNHEEATTIATDVPDNSDEPSDNANVDSIPADTVEEQASTDEPQSAIEEMIAEAYEDNKKMVKMRLLDRNEFKETVIEKTLERVAADGILPDER